MKKFLYFIGIIGFVLSPIFAFGAVTTSPHFWIKQFSYPASQIDFVGRTDGTYPFSQQLVYDVSVSKYSFYIYDSSYHYTYSIANPSLNVWHDFYATQNGTTYTFYLDGVSQDTTTATEQSLVGTWTCPNDTGDFTCTATDPTGGGTGTTTATTTQLFINGFSYGEVLIILILLMIFTLHFFAELKNWLFGQRIENPTKQRYDKDI